jgi:hypothetical protein
VMFFTVSIVPGSQCSSVVFLLTKGGQENRHLALTLADIGGQGDCQGNRLRKFALRQLSVTAHYIPYLHPVPSP